MKVVHFTYGFRPRRSGENRMTSVTLAASARRTWCPSREGESLDNVGFVYFDDTDGNGWTVQQISSRD